VHVVGCVTDEVYSFLGPATQALARTHVNQAVVMVDELRYRHHVSKLSETAELILTRKHRNPIKQWRAVMQACREAFARAPMQAVHLHGLLPCLVGAWAMRGSAAPVPIFYSPHASRSQGTLRAIGALPMLLARSMLRESRGAEIVNVPREKSALERWRSVELVESPVGEIFFSMPRNEARHPLIVTGGRVQSVASVERLAQLAVLLSGEDLRISFNWIGIVDAVSRARLKAADVGVFDVAGDAEYAARLATGWIYVAPASTRGFPLFLIEAMAAGLPCVALDDPQHREVIRHGETGYLCPTETEMISCIAALIDNPELRVRIGAAARAEARRRFGEPEFGVKLLAAYGLPGSEMAAISRPPMNASLPHRF
jgi:glycosyltransferase involved in cell wall biosynthesis